jgi:hypothetical protein
VNTLRLRYLGRTDRQRDGSLRLSIRAPWMLAGMVLVWTGQCLRSTNDPATTVIAFTLFIGAPIATHWITKRPVEAIKLSVDTPTGHIVTYRRPGDSGLAK